MRTYFFFLWSVLFIACSSSKQTKNSTDTSIDLTTPFETDNKKSATYEEGIAFWTNLSKVYSQVQLFEFGTSDIGKPLTAVVISKNQVANLGELQNSEQAVLLINNAIHAGEPCGVDASMLVLKNLLQQDEFTYLLDHLLIVVVPFYNVGGALNRNSTTRTNQVGPKEYGFRGNAKNLDLNRDFIKADSKNARSFHHLFSTIQPDVFLDTHTTNGADYQYNMTLISSKKELYQAPLQHLFIDDFVPFLYREMEQIDNPMTPYVYQTGETPFEGIIQFNDLPRYSMGYASLFQTLSFTTEAHMLKPYKERVEATKSMMEHFIHYTSENSYQIQKDRALAIEQAMQSNYYDMNWELDTTSQDSIYFLGYEFSYKPSVVSGKNRLYYDNQNARNQFIPYFHKYKSTLRIKKPKFYVIPQAYDEVISRLQANFVEMSPLEQDTTILVTAYRIKDFDTRSHAYENHYLHSNVTVEPFQLSRTFYKGDWLVNPKQYAGNYIIESLEPEGVDSFFAWNFFDGIVQQKEYFSPYVFEDSAAKLLEEHPDWRNELEQKKAEDPKFAASAYDQLFFIYKKSQHYERTHNLYPVFRIE